MKTYSQLSRAMTALGLCLLINAVPAHAFPDFGRNVNGQCFVCHSTIVNDRMELFDFTGVVDPVERNGVPDQGLLKYYTVEAGSSVSLNFRATNGEEDYAFRLLGFEELDVTQGNALVFTADPVWDEYVASNLTYYARSDGPFDGYDWLTQDPTEVGFVIDVDAATGTGYYLLDFALVGRDPNRDGWYHSELFYLEVTSGGGGFDLTVDMPNGCPGAITVSWSGSPGTGQQALVIGNNLGSTTIPNNPCAGTILGIQGQVQMVDPPGFFSNGGGSGSISGQVRAAGVCGKYLQLVKGGTCETSSVAQIN